ncbi:bifunctional hydroxymethylpyrimidine kinase/phosphomethylpyrimidine kinase [Hyphococcus sp.]|uniref:bifunctional hydroxymethylpyrimidine kinase/phosphomethylpyrimidine kinase n=1 Tax=Hyphococcus sp. TaxID=2038636 RepID=UPI003D0A5964
MGEALCRSEKGEAKARNDLKGRVLIIAGSDPSGGAGIQADIKTVTALGGYAAAAITALTVQNTKGVSAVHAVAPDIIAAQIEAVMEDIGADAIKIGMIGDVETAAVIDTALRKYSGVPVVLDPVLIATSGDALAKDGVAAFIKEKLSALSTVLTPNIDEAAALTGMEIETRDAMITAGEALVALGAKAALVKGGHMSGETVEDALVSAEGARIFSNPRIDTTSTHGTGCTLASAIATGLAQGLALQTAVKRAVDYVHKAIATAPGYGVGHGPLNHAWVVEE